ncbi:MAG: MBOAT family O-acyltransferase [Rhodospirillales bacterium]
MIYSSYAFIFGFLPASLLAYHLVRRHVGGHAAIFALIAASLFFYGYWNPPYLALLVGSVVANYGFAWLTSKSESRWPVALGVVANLAVLGYFKYRNFFLENAAYALDIDLSLGGLVVPLAISFFTFQQIAFLIDCHNRRAALPPFPNYAAFIIFFPQLIAGPIVLFREMDKQLQAVAAREDIGLAMAGPGVVIFAIGLFKKVVVADTLGPYANAAFANAETLTFLEAWIGSTTYALQLYFDFSGYSDMAVGLALMFGFRIPFNFDTPFRATSMVEFWKRWHITMTRFFMNYLYSPIAIAFTRFSMQRRLGRYPDFALTILIPIFITFALSGLWHGADWTFVMFGLVNAAGLICNHFWGRFKLPPIPAILGWFLTMIVVVVSFVYFRADTMADAHAILGAMAVPTNFALPNWLSGLAEALGAPWRSLSLFVQGAYTVRLFVYVALAGILSLVLANPAADPDSVTPSWRWAAVAAAMLCIAVGLIERPQAFIYFQF